MGCGSIGTRHIRNLIALKAHHVVACEVDSNRASHARQEFGIQVFFSLDDALQSTPDGVLICTPPALHLAVICRAVQAGCHVFIEKPISNVSAGLEDCLSEAESRSLVTFVGYNWRFHPHFQRMKRLFEEEAIGNILCARVNCGQYLPDWHPREDYRRGYSARKSLGGGILLDSHELDYLTWFLGKPKVVLCATGKISDLQIETEDTADIVLRFDQGIQASVHLDYLQRPAGRSYEYFGSSGTILWSLGDGLSVYKAASGRWETISDPAGYDLNSTYVDELRHFIGCVRDREKPLIDGRRGKYVLDLVLAAKKSAEEQRAVALQED